MVRETWEMWADEYQDYWEAKGNYAEIDELRQRLYGTLEKETEQ
jgi:hypothetical protein